MSLANNDTPSDFQSYTTTDQLFDPKSKRIKTDSHHSSLCSCRDAGRHFKFSYGDAYTAIKSDTEFESPIDDYDMVDPDEEIITENFSDKTGYSQAVMSPLSYDVILQDYNPFLNDSLDGEFTAEGDISKPLSGHSSDQELKSLEISHKSTKHIPSNEDDLTPIGSTYENFEKKEPLKKNLALCSKLLGTEPIKQGKSEFPCIQIDSGESTSNSSVEILETSGSSEESDSKKHEIVIVNEQCYSKNEPKYQQINFSNPWIKEHTLGHIPYEYNSADWVELKTLPPCLKEDSLVNNTVLLSNSRPSSSKNQNFVNFRDKFLGSEQLYFKERKMRFFSKNAAIFICYTCRAENVPSFLRFIPTELIENNIISEFDFCIENSSKKRMRRHCHIPYNSFLVPDSLIPRLALSGKLKYFHCEISLKVQEMSYRVFDITKPSDKRIITLNLGDENLEYRVTRVKNIDAKTIQEGISEIKSIKKYKKHPSKIDLSKRFCETYKESLISQTKSRILQFSKFLTYISKLNFSKENLYALKKKLKVSLKTMIPMEIDLHKEMIFSSYDMKITSLYHFIVVKCGKFEHELLRLIEEYQKIDP